MVKIIINILRLIKIIFNIVVRYNNILDSIISSQDIVFILKFYLYFPFFYIKC